MILDCKNYGLMTETEVSCEGRRLVTQGLDIQTLVKLWRWYYNIPPFEKVFLAVPQRLYELSQSKTYIPMRSVREVFHNEGIEIICKEAEE